MEDKKKQTDHCATKITPSCCSANNGDNANGFQIDWLYHGSVFILIAAFTLHLLPLSLPYVSEFSHAAIDLLKTMWWGIVLGIVAVAFMQKVPREYFTILLGRGDTIGGLFRAALAGLLLDLCSHGILMVGAKLYERGTSLGQVMTFLIASPWNSLTLTIILVSLIGLPWTLAFIAGSAVIALCSGFIFMMLTKHGILESNPHSIEVEKDYNIREDFKARIKNADLSPQALFKTLKDGYSEGRMVLRWLFFGTILAALIRAFVSTEMLSTYFGPSLIGLSLTLLATTIIEVCSEGSAPIGAELVTRAGAPGNGFTFLMAGVATDYTEILVIREFTKSWKTALFLPLVTVPQVLLLGWIMNQAV